MIILIVLVGIMLVIYSLVGILKEENKFDRILEREENTKEEWEIEIGRVRSEFATTLSELQSEIIALSEKFEDSKGVSSITTNTSLEIKKSKSVTDEEYEVEEKSNEKEESGQRNNSVMINDIKEFLNQGKTVEEISEILNIGKGEILLIKQLYIN